VSPVAAPERRDAATKSPCSDGRGLTLEQRVSGVWEGLRAVGHAECVVCGGRIEAEGSAGRCARCGSTLS
jgi:hypothetical protein